MLQVPVLGVGVSRGGLPLGVELQEVVGHLLDAALGLLLGLGPGVGAELVDFRLGAFLAAVLRDAVQTMDAHVEHVPAAVGEANGLLHLPVDFNFVKSAELADAVVDVDHEVAHFERHQFLDGQGLLVLAEAFLQSEAVVALEQLVVRVDQNLELLVYKPFAELHRNGLVGHGLLALFEAVVEDVVEALELRRLAANDDVDVAVFVVGPKVGRDEVKLLVEGGLGGHPVFQDHPVGPRRSAAKLHHRERLEQPFEVLSVQEQFFRRGALHLAAQAVIVGAGAFHGLVESRFAALRVGHPKHRAGGQEAEEGFVGFVEAGIADVGDDGGARHFGHAQLRGGVKLPDGVHLVAKELDAVRVVEAEREDVDDAAAHAVLPGLVDEVHLFKLVGQQHLVEEIHGIGFAEGDGEGLVAEFLAGDDLLGQRLGEGDDAQPVAAPVDFVEHLGTHGDVGVLHRLCLGVRHTRRTGIEQYRPRLLQHGL